MYRIFQNGEFKGVAVHYPHIEGKYYVFDSYRRLWSLVAPRSNGALIPDAAVPKEDLTINLLLG